MLNENYFLDGQITSVTSARKLAEQTLLVQRTRKVLVSNPFNHPKSKYQKLYLELDALDPAETWIVDAAELGIARLAAITNNYKERTYRVIRSHRIPGSSKILFVRLL